MTHNQRSFPDVSAPDAQAQLDVASAAQSKVSERMDRTMLALITKEVCFAIVVAIMIGSRGQAVALPFVVAVVSWIALPRLVRGSSPPRANRPVDFVFHAVSTVILFASAYCIGGGDYTRFPQAEAPLHIAFLRWLSVEAVGALWVLVVLRSTKATGVLR